MANPKKNKKKNVEHDNKIVHAEIISADESVEYRNRAVPGNNSAAGDVAISISVYRNSSSS